MNEKTERLFKSTAKDQMSFSADHWLQRAFVTGFLLGRYEDKITEFVEKHPEARVDLVYGGIELVGGTREQVLDFIKLFGGKWTKELDGYREGKIRYEQAITVPWMPDYVTIQFTASDSPPPPSCQIVEEEIKVPARTEKRKKIVCAKPEEDDVPLVPVPANSEVPL